MASGGELEAQDTNEIVVLESSDRETFEVNLRVAKVSRTLATMLEDLGHKPTDVIPLPNVNSRILKKVLSWADYYVRTVSQTSTVPTSTSSTPPHHLGTPASPTLSTLPQMPPLQPRPQPRVPYRPTGRAPPPSGHTLSQWERDFIAKNRDDVYDLLLAANYLDIKGLLDILCRTIADIIKGKNPDEIRRTFNVADSGVHTPSPSPSPSPSPAHAHTHTQAQPAQQQQQELNRHRETAV